MFADLLLSEENVRRLALTLLHFLWQGSLLGALAWSTLHILKLRGAQARYAIHCGLLLLLIAAPLATFLSLSASAGPTLPQSMRLALDEADPSSATNLPASPAGPIANGQQGYATTFRAWLERAQSWLVAGWFLGSMMFGIRLALGAVGVWRLMRTRQPLPAEVAVMVDRLIQTMAFRVRPAVYATEHVSQAIAIGVFKPMVLIPAAWVLELQPVMLEAVVAHELAHLRRWDLPINVLQRLVETLLFFHPVVWWCSRRLRIERELCCDERATQATGDREGYAEALTFLAERQVSLWEPLLAAGIGGSRMVLLERIRNVLGVSRRAHGRFYGLSCAVVGAATASLAWLAILYLPSGGSNVEVAPIQSPPAATARRMAWPTSKQSSSSADGKALPSENKMATLPDYVIEPPDVLFIEAIHVVPNAAHRIQNGDVLRVELAPGVPAGRGSGPNGDQFLVNPSGQVDLGPEWGEAGRVQVRGLTTQDAAMAIETVFKTLPEMPKRLHVNVQLVQSGALQPITGEHLVAPDGTVNLGTYGRVQLAGMTLDEGRAAIERHLETTLDKPQVFLSVFAYNSKVYYVVTEGEGLGDTVARFPITGHETVLDALAEMNGLKQLQSKQIWIARPSAGGAGCDAILPVNWKEITTGGATASNYQVLPGDRIFISDSPPKTPSKAPSKASDAASVDGAASNAAAHTADAAAPPVLEYVRYFGNKKISPRALAKETGLKRKDVFDAERIAEAARKIRALYRAKGFENTRVDIIEGMQPGSRGAVFLIYEGGKPSGVEISFEGNNHEASSESHLLHVVQSPTPKSEPASPQDNEDRLTNYYRSLGFFKSRVEHRVSYDPQQDRLLVAYKIDEGPRYSIRNVKLDGNKAFPAETLLPVLKLGAGEPFDQSSLRADIAALKSFYGGHGFAAADAIAQLRFSAEPGVVDLVYQIAEGARSEAGIVRVR